MKEKLILEDFKYFGGKHCLTTALKNVFAYHDLHLSEEMFFGLNGGLGFMYWYMKMMPAPFIGGLFGKGAELMLKSCQRAGGKAMVFETASERKGYEELKKLLKEGEPAAVFVDMPYLSYMVLPEMAHFGGHTVVVYGLDEEEDIVYISERAKKGLTTSIKELRKARSSKYPPFPAENKMLKIKYPSSINNLDGAIVDSIKESCQTMLRPPIKNFGLAGIEKWASLVPGWPEQFQGIDMLGCLLNVFVYIEIGGTGGSAFRPMYAAFLKEAVPILNKTDLNEAASKFGDCGKIWSEVARAALPDDIAVLKRLRQLMIEKNRVFEEQKDKALEKMKKINVEINHLIKEAVKELKGDLLKELLDSMRQRILELHDREKEAWQLLETVIR